MISIYIVIGVAIGLVFAIYLMRKKEVEEIPEHIPEVENLVEDLKFAEDTQYP